MSYSAEVQSQRVYEKTKKRTKRRRQNNTPLLLPFPDSSELSAMPLVPSEPGTAYSATGVFPIPIVLGSPLGTAFAVNIAKAIADAVDPNAAAAQNALDFLTKMEQAKPAEVRQLSANDPTVRSVAAARSANRGGFGSGSDQSLAIPQQQACTAIVGASEIVSIMVAENVSYPEACNRAIQKYGGSSTAPSSGTNKNEAKPTNSSPVAAAGANNQSKTASVSPQQAGEVCSTGYTGKPEQLAQGESKYDWECTQAFTTADGTIYSLLSHKEGHIKVEIFDPKTKKIKTVFILSNDPQFSIDIGEGRKIVIDRSTLKMKIAGPQEVVTIIDPKPPAVKGDIPPATIPQENTDGSSGETAQPSAPPVKAEPMIEVDEFKDGARSFLHQRVWQDWRVRGVLNSKYASIPSKLTIVDKILPDGSFAPHILIESDKHAQIIAVDISTSATYYPEYGVPFYYDASTGIPKLVETAPENKGIDAGSVVGVTAIVALLGLGLVTLRHYWPGTEDHNTETHTRRGRGGATVREKAAFREDGAMGMLGNARKPKLPGMSPEGRIGLQRGTDAIIWYRGIGCGIVVGAGASVAGVIWLLNNLPK